MTAKKKAKRHEGWAPCFHVGDGVTSEEADAQEGAWLAEVTKDIPRGRGDELAEALLYEVTHYASVTLDSDQWVMVTANGSVTRDGANLFETMIQGDHFLLALAETYRVRREKREELAKR